MGLILLVGLVVKNGIVLMDFAARGNMRRARRGAKRSSRPARVRFRPIMMTTLCTLAGCCPSPSASGPARSCSARLRLR